MPLNENDPEVKMIMDKLDLELNKQTALEAKKKVHEKQHRQIQEQLYIDTADLNQIIGGIRVLNDMIDHLKGVA